MNVLCFSIKDRDYRIYMKTGSKIHILTSRLDLRVKLFQKNRTKKQPCVVNLISDKMVFNPMLT